MADTAGRLNSMLHSPTLLPEEMKVILYEHGAGTGVLKSVSRGLWFVGVTRALAHNGGAPIEE